MSRRRFARLGLLLAAFGPFAAAPAMAHDGVVHATPKAAAAHAQAGAGGVAPAPDAASGLPFPVEIRMRFDLIDHNGVRRTEADYAGRPALVFFGYANCKAICSIALPRVGAALDLLGDKAARIDALMITVDPVNDTPAAMARALPRWHPRLVGLTGSPEALAEARAAFQIQAEKLFDLPDGTPVFSHGSFIYLVGSDGRVLAILPPILSEARLAEIIGGYI